MALNKYSLTVPLVSIQGTPVSGVDVTVALVDQTLRYPIVESATDMTSETLYPTINNATTDSMGEARFMIMPSVDDGDQPGVGDYAVTVGSYSKVITMPASNARLADL